MASRSARHNARHRASPNAGLVTLFGARVLCVSNPRTGPLWGGYVRAQPFRACSDACRDKGAIMGADVRGVANP
jgi:hypothetical protein